jgi:peptidase E
MLKVDAIVSTPDAYRQQQYYAGTHLVHYPISKERAQIIPKFENGIFKRYLEKPNGQRDLISTSTTREKQFLSLRQEHHNREELFQRLNYQNGVHYSAQNSLRHLLD